MFSCSFATPEKCFLALKIDFQARKSVWRDPQLDFQPRKTVFFDRKFIFDARKPFGALPNSNFNLRKLFGALPEAVARKIDQLNWPRPGSFFMFCNIKAKILSTKSLRI